MTYHEEDSQCYALNYSTPCRNISEISAVNSDFLITMLVKGNFRSLGIQSGADPELPLGEGANP